VLALVLILLGCEQSTAPSRTKARARPAPPSSASGSVRVAPAASSPASAAPIAAVPATSTATAASHDEPRAPRLRCVAASSGKRHTLTKAGPFADLTFDDSYLYLLTWDQSQVLMELAKVAKDGSGVTVLARLQEVGEPTDVAVDSSGVYFTKRQTLYRASSTASAPERLAEHFGERLELHGDYVYGAGNPPKGRGRRVVRIAKQGGEVDTLASWSDEHRRQWGLAVDDQRAYVTSWGARKVYSVDLKDRHVTEIASRQPFAADAFLSADDVFFFSSKGLGRAAKAGGEVTTLDPPVYMPFAIGAADDETLWVFDTWGRNSAMFLVSKKTGESRSMGVFSTSVNGIAVDPDCLYLAYNGWSYTVLQAIRRPGDAAPKE
jgi:hypothetical protein